MATDYVVTLESDSREYHHNVKRADGSMERIPGTVTSKYICLYFPDPEAEDGSGIGAERIVFKIPEITAAFAQHDGAPCADCARKVSQGAILDQLITEDPAVKGKIRDRLGEKKVRGSNVAQKRVRISG